MRTRFAPSPTGSLHLGNVRIAAFNWLLARRHGGAFVVRIEDTDVARTVEGSEEGILADLRWLGLDWDEGPDVGGPHAPYRQSERERIHREAADRLVAEGRAYRCWCGEVDLEAGRERVGEGRDVHRYSGRCRRLPEEERRARTERGDDHVIRFALPEGLDTIEIMDEVRGPISFPASDFDDFVIRRADGRVTYNLAVVVDDVAMEISHVVRGAGHLSNTPKQALLFDALGEGRPVFAHLPTVLAPEGGKLSKRRGAASVDHLRREGYNSTGVVNYLSLLGWSSPDGREVLDMDELRERISLERVGASDTALDPEKLRWVSGQHIQHMPIDALVDALRPYVDRERFPLDERALAAAAVALRSRLTTYGEINDHLDHVLPQDAAALEDARRQVRDDPGAAEVLRALRDALAEAPVWDADVLGGLIRATGKAVGARGAALFHPLRQAVTGRESGPDLAALLVAVGREETLARLDCTLDG